MTSSFESTFNIDPFSIPYLSLLGVEASLQSSNKTSTSSVNLTSGKIPDAAENIGSLVNSAVFIVALTIVFFILIGFYIKQKSDMKRNQQLLFWLVGIICIIEITGLSLRVVYNATALHMNHIEWQKLPNLLDYRIVLWVFAVLENAVTYSEVVTITLVMGFVQDIFVTTAAAAGSMSKKFYRRLRIALIAFSMIAAVILTAVIVVNATLNLLVKMSIIDKNAGVPLQIVLLIIYFFTSVCTLIVFAIVSARLVQVVNKTSKNISKAVSSNQKKQKRQVPYAKIVGLMAGMILSSFLQILSAIISFLTSSFAGYLHILDYFCQAFGVLVFVVFVLLLYNPLWRREVAEDQQRALDDTSSETSQSQRNQSMMSKRKSLKVDTPTTSGSLLKQVELMDAGTPVSPTVQSPKAIVSSSGDISPVESQLDGEEEEVALQQHETSMISQEV